MTDIGETRDLSPNRWFSIWLQPRATIQQIIDTDPGRFVLVLVAAGGIVEALNRASSNSAGDTLGLPAIFSVAIVVGAIGGILSLFVFSALIRWTGRRLGGAANDSWEIVRTITRAVDIEKLDVEERLCIRRLCRDSVEQLDRFSRLVGTLRNVSARSSRQQITKLAGNRILEQHVQVLCMGELHAGCRWTCRC